MPTLPPQNPTVPTPILPLPPQNLTLPSTLPLQVPTMQSPTLARQVPTLPDPTLLLLAPTRRTATLLLRTPPWLPACFALATWVYLPMPVRFPLPVLAARAYPRVAATLPFQLPALPLVLTISTRDSPPQKQRLAQ